MPDTHTLCALLQKKNRVRKLTRRGGCRVEKLLKFLDVNYSSSAFLPTIPSTKPMTPPLIAPMTVAPMTSTISGASP